MVNDVKNDVDFDVTKLFLLYRELSTLDDDDDDDDDDDVLFVKPFLI